MKKCNDFLKLKIIRILKLTTLLVLVVGLQAFAAETTTEQAEGQVVLSADEALADIAVKLQPVTITGTVTDEDGLPYPGVYIQIQGTTRGAMTDTEGNYTLAVEGPNDVLIYSFVGTVTQEIQVGNQTVINVTLVTEVSQLQDIVVVGYGTMAKSDLTGAITKIKTEDIENVPVIRIDQALQGKSAGVFVTSSNGAPGAGTTIRIRGGNSITANNEPLYVIDGFIGGGDLNSINPRDIESLEILKDATATSIYGARGANGVILITTKSGKQGPPKINLDYFMGWQMLPRKVDVLNSEEFVEYVNEDANAVGAPEPYPAGSTIYETDWQEEVSQVAPMKNLQFSASGGNNNLMYYVSGNYVDQDGIILNSGIKRYQLRTNFDINITDNFRIGTRINLSRSDKTNNTVGFENAIEAFPSSPIYLDNGDFHYINDYTGLVYNNPVAQATLPLDETLTNRILSNIYAEFNILDIFQFRSTLGTDLVNVRDNEYTPGQMPSRKAAEQGGQGMTQSRDRVQILNENTLSFNKDIGQHGINGVLGFTVQNSVEETVRATGAGFTNDALLYHALETGDPEQRDVNTNYTEWTILSSLARINYSFQDKYLLTLIGRRDGSSRLGTNNKWAFFPSVSAAWRLTQEDFIRNLGIFSHLKLRASYGLSGNQAVGVYSTLPSLIRNTVIFNGSENVGFVQGNLANPNLKWETTSQYDVGLEGGIMQGRISFEMDYYYKKTEDLLLEVEIPWQTGYSTTLRNIGAIENQGFEFMLKTVNFTTTDFQWSTSFNISTNRNEVLDIGDNESIIIHRIGRGQARKVVELRVGDPVGAFVGAVYEGTWKTQQEIDDVGTMPSADPGSARYKDVDGNGSFDGEQDFVVIGDPTPTFFGGIQNTLSYKNLDLSFFLQYSYGNDVCNTLNMDLAFPQAFNNQYGYYTDRWTSSNPDSDIPAAGGNELTKGMPSDAIIEDGSYLRLKNLTLSYGIPVDNIPWINEARIYITGYNLFLLDDYQLYDPDVNSYGTESVRRGIDNGAYPQPRSYFFGVNLTF